ncbi:MAG: alpha/beta fold hydrolase BchO [Pseudomonadota bacterium]
MEWRRHRDYWPHADHSRFVPTGGLGGLWHVQEMGTGPELLLLHGAGGATQSWRTLMPLLAEHYRCIAVDLPGQGFSKPRVSGRYGLDAMARDIASLAWGEGWRPRAIIGHSAGGALALRMAEEGVADTVIGINAALGRFDGVAGWAFPLAAKLMALNPLTATFFSTTSSSPGAVRRLLDSTGSKIDPEGQRLYRALVGSSSHVDGTLRMMASWSLDGLLARMPQNMTRTVLIAAENDKTVPPSVSEKAAARMSDARVIRMPGLGHLAHEEAPEAVAAQVMAALALESLNAQ